MMAEQDKVALKSLTDNGMTANELTPEAQKAFVEVSKSCYPKFRALIKDDALFDKTAEFTGRK